MEREDYSERRRVVAAIENEIAPLIIERLALDIEMGALQVEDAHGNRLGAPTSPLFLVRTNGPHATTLSFINGDMLAQLAKTALWSLSQSKVRVWIRDGVSADLIAETAHRALMKRFDDGRFRLMPLDAVYPLPDITDPMRGNNLAEHFGFRIGGYEILIDRRKAVVLSRVMGTSHKEDPDERYPIRTAPLFALWGDWSDENERQTAQDILDAIHDGIPGDRIARAVDMGILQDLTHTSRERGLALADLIRGV